MRSLEVDLQNKTDTIEMEKLQRRIEYIEKSIRKLGGEDKEEKLIQKSLKDRDIEEKERQNRRKNVSFWAPRVRQNQT